MPASSTAVATLWSVQTEQLQMASDGTRTEQRWEFTTPAVQVTVQSGGQTQRRSSAGQYNGFCQQGGLEVLERAGFREHEARASPARRWNSRARPPARAACST